MTAIATCRSPALKLVSGTDAGEDVEVIDERVYERLNRRPICRLPLLESSIVSSLAKANILSVGEFLKRARTPRDRMLLAVRTGLPARTIFSAACIMDLSRIRTLPDYAIIQFLECGIRTVAEFARQDPVDLVIAVLSTSDDETDLGWTHSNNGITQWISEARMLPKLLY